MSVARSFEVSWEASWVAADAERDVQPELAGQDLLRLAAADCSVRDHRAR